MLAADKIGPLECALLSLLHWRSTECPVWRGTAHAALVLRLQNSTVLWESLPADVMEQAMRLHHATFRRLLAKHNGYESATGSGHAALRCALGPCRRVVTDRWPVTWQRRSVGLFS
jgi:hypothetical protein